MVHTKSKNKGEKIIVVPFFFGVGGEEPMACSCSHPLLPQTRA